MLHVCNYYGLAAAPAPRVHLHCWRSAHICPAPSAMAELKGEAPFPPPPDFCDGAEVSLITAHARFQSRPGSDGLESTPTIITYSGLVL